MDSLVAYYGHVQVVTLRYHSDYPWVFDPFYLANPTESDNRRSYYNVLDGSIPTTMVDGNALTKKCILERFRGPIEDDLALTSPLKMTATDSLGLDSCFVRLFVVAEGTPASDSMTLRLAVVEDSIYYEAPNGHTDLKAVFREFVGGPEGFDFEISEGETLEFDFTFALDPGWDADVISTVAFIQDDTDKSVIQATSSRDRMPVWGYYSASKRGETAPPGSAVAFPSTFVNLGTAADTFDIDFLSDLPADWTAGYQVSGGAEVPGGVALDADSTCTITIEIGCGYDPGTGNVSVILTSGRDPSFSRRLEFFAVAGVCGLLVDDDDGHDLETYYEDALDSLGVAYGRWDRSIEAPDSADLEMADFVVWFVGTTFPTLNEYDQQVIASYHDGGGKLFITGQDIGFRLCNAQSDEYSLEAVAFYETYLHASYIMPNANLWELSGRPGDPIGDGIDLVIEGGDGADNQTYPDVIDSIAPARVIFDYSDPAKHGGVRFESGSTQVVYLSFGFEAISNAPDRVLLLSRIISWFGLTAGVDDGSVKAVSVTCYPNPAVSYATIALRQDANPGAAPGVVEIYDVLGRLVAAGTIPARGVFTWDLRDGNGERAAPGVYFVAVSTDRRVGSKKLILTR